MSDKVAVYLEDVVEALEMTNDECEFFCNTETGEVVYYSESFPDESEDPIDPEEFVKDKYVALPSRYELNEYGMMERFAEEVQDSHKRELLAVALEGKGAFRRFKDTLYRVDMVDEWYAFKDQAFLTLAREWCEENEIPYKLKKPV